MVSGSPLTPDKPSVRASLTLTVAAVGIVFGDIGTSPLYALRECLGGHGVAPTAPNVLGVVSLIFWSLVVVVTIKYLVFLMRADNGGEGGILALLALVPERYRPQGGRVGWVALLVMAGAALLYGDGIITPAISVLSAMEGLSSYAPQLTPAVLPLTCAVILVLFFVQRRGTGRVGALFGPVMCLWFVVIAALGAVEIVARPQILRALSPSYAVGLFTHNGWQAVHVLGFAVLAVTGGEALYADMGHFGRGPIRRGWAALVFPALMLSYLGQAAAILGGTPADHAFYHLVPAGAWRLAMVTLATLATAVASQALISGAFSLTQQAIQLGYFPRMEVKQTAADARGQIYVPLMNWVLAAGCLALVLVFRDSSGLAAAYGLAVSGTMAVTSIAFYMVVRTRWSWSRPKALAVVSLFLLFDLPFLFANLLKVPDGGFIPLAVGAVFFAIMFFWRRGRGLLAEALRDRSHECQDLDAVVAHAKARVPGVGVFMASAGDEVPPMILHYVQRTGALHETVIVLTVGSDLAPRLESYRVQVTPLGHGFYRATAHYGFMQRPNIPELLRQVAAEAAVQLQDRRVTYFVGRETFLATSAGKMPHLSESLFAWLSRNARPATAYFHLPPEQVVEVGLQIDL